jgi:hypothetical protein
VKRLRIYLQPCLTKIKLFIDMPSTFLQGSLQICDLHNSTLGGGGELAAGEVGPEQAYKRCGCAIVS